MKLCPPGLGIFPGQTRNGFVQKQLGLAALAGGLADSLRSGAAVIWIVYFLSLYLLRSKIYQGFIKVVL